MLKKIIQLFSKNELEERNVSPVSNLAKFDSHLVVLPQDAESLKKVGDQLFKSSELAQAKIYYKQSLDFEPNQYEVYKNLGVICYYQKRLEEAITYYDQAIALKPDYAEAYSNRGLALNDLGRFEEALANLNLAIQLKPDFAFAYNNRGLALKNLNKLEDALASYDRAIALKPDYAVAFKNRGIVLEMLKSLSDALVSFESAIKLDPDIELGYGLFLALKALFSDWGAYETYLEQLRLQVNRGRNVSQPLVVLWLLDSPGLQKRTGEIFIKSSLPANNTMPLISKHTRHNKIRIGYFSGEFYNHAVTFLTAELFERHDKSKFELIAFSYSAWKDDMTERLKHGFDQFIDLSGHSKQEMVLIARNLKIDIAIDLGGLTGDSRIGLFAERVAPIQINYLGYPGTMGADFMDYIIADATTIPVSHQQYYTEKVVYLPCFQVNDTKRGISDRKFSREELGLPSTGFVFCCFNNITKINPTIYDIWMRILKQVDGSVLWLVDANPIAVNNLRKEAIYRGVDGNRLIFAKRESLSDHLARYRIADLFLDTVPFNAGTTASDALWSGLPVLTLIGESFAGRMAASLLNAIHLPELITTTQEEYEACAINLATKPEKLKDIKQKLASNRLTTPLFDIEYFTNNIESAYIQMYERYQAGLEPDHINVVSKY